MNVDAAYESFFVFFYYLVWLHGTIGSLHVVELNHFLTAIKAA